MHFAAEPLGPKALHKPAQGKRGTSAALGSAAGAASPEGARQKVHDSLYADSRSRQVN